MIPLNSNSNVDNSDLINYPDGRIKDNTGTGNGTPVNRNVYGDLHSNISKLMRLYGIVPSGLPDNETNGFQIIDSLKALASKNDYIYPLTTNGTILSVDIKLSLMKDNEFLVCLASADKTTETQIKGLGTGTFSITYSGSFKANEYVRVIKTNVGVSIVRIADWNSLEAMVSELGFLKKASYAQEIAGTSDTVATNPLSNVLAFVERVNGSASSMSLATLLRNGLYPKEHFAIVSGIGADPVKNKGWFSGLNVSMPAGPLSFGGDITDAVVETPVETGTSSILVTMANAMVNTTYKVRIDVQSEGVFYDDLDAYSFMFRPTSNLNQFRVVCSKLGSKTTNLKVHLEVVQL